MSGSAYTPPVRDSLIFNNLDFFDPDEDTSTADNDLRYLKLVGGDLNGALTVSSTLDVTGDITASSTLDVTGLVASTTGFKSTVSSGVGVYLKDSGTTPFEHYSDSDDYQLVIHNATATSGELTGIAFLSSPGSCSTTAPGALITHDRTGAYSIGDLVFSTKESTSCVERVRIFSTGELAINSTTAALQCEINEATGQCLRLKYNDSSSIHIDFKVSSAGILKIEPTTSATISTGSPNALSLIKESYRKINNTDTADAYNLVVNYDGDEDDQNIGIAFSHCTDYTTMSPGAAIGFIPASDESSYGHGCLTFSTKTLDTSACNPCEERLRINEFGLIGINQQNPTFPLHISKTTSVDIADFGYINSTGNIGTTDTGTANSYSLFTSGRIAATGEVDCISDHRAKTNIEPLEINYCKKFIDTTLPVIYNYKNELNKKSTGYIAQDVFKAGFEDLISLLPNPDMVRSVDDDGFINPAGNEFCISTGEIIAILQVCIKDLYEKLDKKSDKRIRHTRK